MIRINLASRKTSSAGLADPGGKTLGRALSGGLGKVDGLKDLPIRKIAVMAIFVLVAEYMLGTYKEDELAKLQTVMAQIEEQRRKSEAELNKTRGFDSIRKQIEIDEGAMRTKIGVIERLVADRATPQKILLSLSSAIPTDVWLTGFKLDRDSATFEGFADNLSLVTDFTKALNESTFFRDVQPKAGSAKDERGGEIATFQLVARRR